MSDAQSRLSDEGGTEVDIKQLKFGLSPRSGEQDLDHAQVLAYRIDECPPILVERSTWTVIDGVHRMLAARILGRSKVTVRFFDGTHEEAFAEAVRANIAHGKPLTLAEREAAAKKILATGSGWSDRFVAEVCGLSGKTVGRLRKAAEEIPQLAGRVGRDGRQRPSDARQLRNQIAAALDEEPEVSVSKLASQLSTSPSTVRDVRKRLGRGDDPASPNPRRNATSKESGSSFDIDSPLATKGDDAVQWSRDSAILALPNGGDFGEWLDRSRILPSHWEGQIHQIPLGRIPQLIADAKFRINEWSRFVSSLEEQARVLHRQT